MQPKKIALISDAWVPQVNGVVTTFQSVIPILEKKGFEIKILHPEMFNNFSYPWYKEIKISFNTKKFFCNFFSIVRNFYFIVPRITKIIKHRRM